MGSHVITHVLDGKKTMKEVEKWFQETKQECINEYGTDPYNGTWSTIDRLTFPKKEEVLDMNFDEAEEWCGPHYEKWEKACAVKFKHTEKIVVRKPTYPQVDGRDITGFAQHGVYAKTRNKNNVLVYLPANELTDKQKEKAVKLAKAMDRTEEDLQKARRPLEQLIQKLWKPGLVLSTDISKARREYFKALKTAEKANGALDKFQTQMRKKLYKSRTSKPEIRWLIIGQAAC